MENETWDKVQPIAAVIVATRSSHGISFTFLNNASVSSSGEVLTALIAHLNKLSEKGQ